MKKKKYNVIDLFAGCGGLSEGFLQSGRFKFLAHIEWEKPMVETLRNNLVKRWNYSEEEAEKSVIRFDIQKTDELLKGNWSKESIKDYGEDNNKKIVEKGMDSLIGNQKVDVIIGGPPCQAYSLAGRAQSPTSMKNDYRNYLFESFVKVVDHYKPKVFVFENVPGILSAKPGDKLVIDRIYESFEKINYEIRNPKMLKRAIYSAADFETPQDRRRIIIIGVRKDYKNNPEDFYLALDELKSKYPIKNVRDAIGNLPQFKPLDNPKKGKNGNISHELIGNDTISDHEARYNNLRDIKVFKKWIKNNMNTYSTEEKLKFYTETTGKKSNHNKYRSLEWDKPSPTIVSHLYKDGLMFIHPDEKQARSITVREAGLLQGFPIDFEFLGSNAYKYKMIGNAVPVQFAKNISMALSNVLDKDDPNNMCCANKKSEMLTLKPKKQKRVLNVLVACEESQRVCTEFRRLGHNAYSCDLLNCSGGHPEWHFNMDVLKVIKDKGGVLENGEKIKIDGDWDLMIAHPPCTFLAVSGAKWYYHPDDKGLPIEQRRPHPRFPNRARDREDGANFFMALATANIKYIAVENPIGIMSKRFRKPDQIIQPYWFGDPFSKATCLWLKNLSPLKPTNMVDKGEYVELKSGKRLPKWYSDALTKAKTPEERRTLRSKTFPGFAKAIAEQWSKEILENESIC